MDKASKNIFHFVYGPLAIYLHFPFCKNHCHYCDFYKDKYDPKTVERFFRAVEYETELVLSMFEREPIDIASIYIGGGTPSLIEGKMLERWLEAVKSYGRLLPGYEFTIETNPESLTNEFAHKTKTLGVNRIIIGVQSFRISSLRLIGRRQRTRDIYRAFYNVNMAGYDNIGADLIFGLPEQRVKHVRTDIDRLIDLEPKHISFYQLTVEDGTRLKKNVDGGRLALPGDNQSAHMYQVGAHLMNDRGYKRYEISNFARDGWRSRHNYAYWQGSPYIGLGPAAHGFAKDFRYGNVADLNKYFEIVESGLLPFEFVEELTEDQKLTEGVMLALRTADGIDKEQLKIGFGKKSLKILEGKVTRRLVKNGYLIDDAGFLRLSDAGFLVADKIIAEILST